MNKLSFPTKKLKGHVFRVKTKYCDYSGNLDVFGVTNTKGICITNKEASSDKSKYIVVSENCFAYNPYRINVGSIGLAPKAFKGIVSPAYVVFKTSDEIVPEFLYFYLKSTLGNNLIKWYGDRGGVRSALRFSDLEKIDFPDVSKQEQLNILNKLNSLNEKRTALIKEQEFQKISINKLRQAILQEAVQGKLVPQDPNDEPASVLLEKIKAEKEKLVKEKKIRKQKPLPPIKEDEVPYVLPKGWEWVRLGETILFDIGGGTPSKNNPSYWKGDINWASVKDLNEDTYLTSTIDKISKKGLDNSSSNLIDKNNIIICTRMGLGKILINKIEVAINQDLRALFLPDYMNKLYFYYFYKTLSFTHTGTTVSGIRREKLMRFLFPLPPLNEQKRIVEKVDQLMKLCDGLEAQVLESKKNSELLMQAVLQEAFEVKVDDHN